MSKKDKFRFQRGVVATGAVLLWGYSALGLGVLGVAKTIYKRNLTEELAVNYEEHAVNLSRAAINVEGEAGDDMIRQAFILNEAAGRIREKKELNYKTEMLGEAAGLATNLVLSGGSGRMLTGLGFPSLVGDLAGVFIDSGFVLKTLDQAEKDMKTNVFKEMNVGTYQALKGTQVENPETDIDLWDQAVLNTQADAALVNFGEFRETAGESSEASREMEKAHGDNIEKLNEAIDDFYEAATPEERDELRSQLAENDLFQEVIQQANLDRATQEVDWSGLYSNQLGIDTRQETKPERRKKPTPTPMATSTPTPIPTPTPTPAPMLRHRDVTARGSWGKSSLRLSFFSKGGGISGSISGFCRGGVSGTYSYNGTDGGRVTGGMSGSCVCLADDKKSLTRCSASGGLSGTVYLKKGYASGRWSGSSGSEALSGSWRVSFTPLEEYTPTGD